MMLVDARGMRCPWPAIRLAKALRERGGGPIEVLADDPAAAAELERVARAAGARLETAEAGRFRVERGA
ncbi:sulfurtransferase TusA family protein [Sphingosinithalassobacter sp. LHW66-3]|uniref:sulfurtransferase TusA family protein n=1 Tax=Sphingosinithalassobacter sp. LHW66-3 TaxID=3424718 RepID=UPI003D6BCC14